MASVSTASKPLLALGGGDTGWSAVRSDATPDRLTFWPVTVTAHADGPDDCPLRIRLYGDGGLT